jgi:tRNA pseudouridine38-40 synthase
LKVKITLSYDGSLYWGSQIQKSTPQTVIGTLIPVLCKLGILDTPIASGRTDRGVHASGQVLHVNLPEYWSDLKKLKELLNDHFPSSLHVKKISEVSDDFHARYSASRRVYRYVLSTQESNPFQARYITFVKTLDFETIKNAIVCFEGEHDFKHFMKQGSDTNSCIRKIYKAMAYQHRDTTILYFEANGFLRSQIRLMVGMLLEISQGRCEISDLQEQLTGVKVHSRKLAPPQGLYLAKIKY